MIKALMTRRVKTQYVFVSLMASAKRRNYIQMFASFLVITQNNLSRFLKWRYKIVMEVKKRWELHPRKHTAANSQQNAKSPLIQITALFQ